MVTRWVTFVAVLITSVVVASAASAAPLVFLAIDGCQSSIGPIETSTSFTVELCVAFDPNEPDYEEFRLDRLSYDPTVIGLDSVGAGEVLSGPLFYADNDISDGTWSQVSGFLEVPNQDGVLALLNFTAVASGDSPLRFEAFPDDPNEFGLVSFYRPGDQSGVAAVTQDAVVTVRQAAPAVVPEPATLSLLSLGLVGIAARLRSRITAVAVRRVRA